jgi:hypothetical protein
MATEVLVEATMPLGLVTIPSYAEHEQLERIAIAAASYVGFKHALKIARRQKLLAMQKNGITELRKLAKTKKLLFTSENDMKVYREKVLRIEEEQEDLRKKMRAAVEPQTKKVERAVQIVNKYEQEMIETLKDADMYYEYNDLPEEGQ